MKCIHDDIILSQYIEKDLDPETMGRITSHIRECSSCRNRMRQLEIAVKIIRSVEEVEPAGDYLEDLCNRRGNPDRGLKFNTSRS